MDVAPSEIDDLGTLGTVKQRHDYSSASRSKVNHPKKKHKFSAEKFPCNWEEIVCACHSVKVSHFSSTSGFKDYSGIMNWVIVLLVLAGTRLALENVLKYGVLISPKQYLFIGNASSLTLSGIVIIVNAKIGLAVCLEKAVASKRLAATGAHWLQSLNLLALILVPPVMLL